MLLLYLPPPDTGVDTPDPALESLLSLPASSHSITVLNVPSNDTWSRDTSPIFLTSQTSPPTPGVPSKLKALDFNFNAYGGPEHGCYWPCDLDVALGSRIASDLLASHESRPDFVFEGGSFCTDGRGTMITTEECLLRGNRNGDMGKGEVESYLLKAMNLRKIIWLPDGLYGDVDTNGHADNFCCFVSPGTVALAWTEDEEDPQWAISNEALRVLEGECDSEGNKLRIVKLLLPKPQYLTEEDTQGLKISPHATERKVGERLAASYVNFYIANGACIVPSFGDEMDEVAREIVEREVGRKAISVYSRNILVGGGNIHCQTMQIPDHTK
ncbi:hypothetical protein TrST_g966 [Triparma strigata]|nr:hypothetical protein TrST_g966 [Triparma strigata]